MGRSNIICMPRKNSLEVIVIQWERLTELSITADAIGDIQIFEKEEREPGYIEQVAILDDNGNFVNMQFSDGSVAYNICKEQYKVVNEQL